MVEMNLARTTGVVIGFLAVLTYGHVISVPLAVLIFFLFAACLVYFHLAELCDEGNNRDNLAHPDAKGMRRLHYGGAIVGMNLLSRDGAGTL
jgi:hypothetical protein